MYVVILGMTTLPTLSYKVIHTITLQYTINKSRYNLKKCSHYPQKAKEREAEEQEAKKTNKKQ